MNEMVPVSINDLQTMALAVAKSGLFGAKTPDQALALMLVAQAEGLHPASAARDYDIINGKGAKKAEAMLRDFLKAGGSVRWHALDDSKADATFSHPAGGEVRIVWDMARVSKAKISNQAMYDKYPRQMLRSRCVSEGVRTVCPMATGGMYAPEEVPEIPEKDMGAAERVDPPKPAGPQPYPAADFAKNLPTWTNLITSGKKTAADIIKTVSSKGTLTDEQKAAINAVVKAPATVDHDTGEINDAPAVNYEALLKRLQTGKSVDVLDADASLIGSIDGQDRQNALAQAYRARRAEVVGG